MNHLIHIFDNQNGFTEDTKVQFRDILPVVTAEDGEVAKARVEIKDKQMFIKSLQFTSSEIPEEFSFCLVLEASRKSPKSKFFSKVLVKCIILCEEGNIDERIPRVRVTSLLEHQMNLVQLVCID